MVKFTLHEYKEALKLVGIYKAVELSLFSYSRDINIFKALLERWSSGTNTFYTLYGEIGISLLDIQKIGGLSSSGEFYDECNPSKEMLGSKHIPQTTIDLYDLIQALGAKPTFQAWIDNFIIPILNHPNSNAVGLQNLKDFPFECRRDYPRNTILAAFLSYWLSGFPLLSMRSEIIRPKTFFMPGKMTQGQIYDLATPALAHLYRQLGNISNLIRDSLPSRFTYNTALELFTNSIEFSFRPYVNFSEGRDLKEYDPQDGDSSLLYQTFSLFLAIRPCVLTYRMGDNLIVEPYEASHFGHQFGYGQHFSQNVDTRCRDGLSLIALLQYWQRMHRHNTGACLITSITNGRGQVTLSYTTWWRDNWYSALMFHPQWYLTDKKNQKGEKISSCGIRDEPRPPTPLRELSPLNENLVRGKEVIFESVDKISSKAKEIFNLEDENDDELFDCTILNDGTPDLVTAQ
ncbi:hypothetical protein ACH5RR_013436 [Cinchona calisaya]|uniref:Aminotransferase-like plant mobile domain-containing protein n=1 Tax=Cinchona calisaya TaxID=153742 RepID=A0ABD3A1E4_9GENT